ncbi:hypothetical protein [Granulicella mallensis]|uniref:Uncharacterized protein n=1 Tax=Granulicella mallensis TaxID=940614 RepID=A0A7W7ZR87_9BACT|nr:hypothetical protein [Granulicella mallensis]MBB5064657.1 hypothetical protein [Granulicella mallensis]
MQDTQIVGFHESSIVSVRRDGKAVVLELDEVHLGSEIRSATITMNDVQSIARDGVGVEDVLAESEDGEVLTLQYTEHSMHLIVEWPDFVNHQAQTRSYRMSFGSINVDIH